MLKIISGHSEKNRITFSTKDSCATAIRKENAEFDFEFQKEDIPISKALTTLFVIFGLSSLLKSFVLIPLIESNTIYVGWYLIPLVLYSLLAILSIIVTCAFSDKELLKNHGAEHKVLSAYNKLKRIPTVEEAQTFSRIHKACGITIYSAFITSQLIGFIVYINLGFIISEIVLFLVPLFFSSFFPFNLIGKLAQFFTTSKPERHNIELAIAAISALEHHESHKKLIINSIDKVFNNE